MIGLHCLGGPGFSSRSVMTVRRFSLNSPVSQFVHLEHDFISFVVVVYLFWNFY